MIWKERTLLAFEDIEDKSGGWSKVDIAQHSMNNDVTSDDHDPVSFPDVEIMKASKLS